MNPLKKILLLLPLILLFSCKHENQIPYAEKGIIDLRERDLEKDGTINLNGRWAFYWENFYSSEDFKQEAMVPDTFVQFPDAWNGLNIGNKKLNGSGYATYRLILLTHPSEQIFGLRTKNQRTSYRLYLNGKLIAENGKIGMTEEEAEPEYKPVLVPIKFSSEKNELILHIANFTHRKGGICHPIILGTYEDILDHRDLYFSFDLLLTGVMLVMFIFFFGMFLYRRHDHASLYFALFCFLMLIRISVTGERFLLSLLPEMKFNTYMAIEYMTFFFGPPVLILFFDKIFKGISNKAINMIILAAASILMIITLSTQVSFYTNLVPVWQIIIILIIFYALYIIIQSVIQKRTGAKIILAAGILMILTVTNDILYVNLTIHTAHLLPLGFFFFIISYAYVLAVNIYVVEKQKSKLETSLKTLSLISETGKQITTRLIIDEITTTVYNSIKYQTDVSIFSIGILNHQEHTVDFPKSYAEGVIQPAISVRLENGNELLSKCIHEKREIKKDELEAEISLQLKPLIPGGKYHKIKSLLFIPMDMNNRSVGILTLYSFTANAYTDYHLQLLRSIASYTAIAIENTHALDQIEMHKEEIKSQRDAILKKNEELRMLNNTKDKFFSIIAHDLKSPFNAILGFSDILLENFKTYDDEKVEEVLGYIKKSSESAFNLTENLFTWARTQSGKLEMHREELYLYNEVNTVIRTLQGAADKKGVEILNAVDQKVSVFADMNMLDTILRNLISNAVKYSNQNGIIKLTAYREDEQTYITVSDSGIGMSDEQIKNLFRLDKTVSTKGTRDEKGTGLGLLICKEFVQRHGGRFSVQSQIGKGSEFCFSIPDPS